MIALEVGSLDGLFIIIMAIMFGPPIFMAIMGFFAKKENPKIAKILFILAVVYLLVGLGVCGSIIG